jgi:four helix bundle protein
MTNPQPLIPPHGGYRKLKSFQIAQLVYDLTLRFCEDHIDRRSRTHDQMVQAARSGVQNMAEGSQASGTSKKMELKLTNVARASLEELRLDYEDFLRQRGMKQWPPNHPALMRFKAKKCATEQEVQQWVVEEVGTQRETSLPDTTGQENTDRHRPTQTAGDRPTRTGRNQPTYTETKTEEVVQSL